METNNRNFKNQIEINDLIDVAVSEALARRSANEEALSELSGEDAGNVTGGLVSVAIAGYIPTTPIITKPLIPPITVGIIALPDYKVL